MSRLKLLAAVAALAVVIPAGGATAEHSTHDYETALAPGETDEFSGGVPAGINPNYFGLLDGTPYPGAAATCNKDTFTYCETVLLTLTAPVEDDGDPEVIAQRNTPLHIVTTPTHPVADFDLRLYESDETGAVLGDQAGESGGTPIADCDTSCEEIRTSVRTFEDAPTRYYVLHIVFFAAPSTQTTTFAFG